jgi:hypothetical protein
MATKVSNLPEKTTLSDTDIIYVVKDGLSGKMTVANAKIVFANSLSDVAFTDVDNNFSVSQTIGGSLVAVNGVFSGTLVGSNLTGTNTGDQNAAGIVLDDTDLVVVPVTDLQAFADGADAALLRARGTGVSTSYVSTVSVGGTTFAQPDVNGEINSDQGYFSITHVGDTGISVNDLTASSTFVYIDNAGNRQQQTTTPTRQDWSRKMFTMRIGVNTSTNTIIGFEYLNNPIGHYANSIRDLYQYLLLQGIPFKADQLITGRAGDLGFDVSAGTLMEFGGTGDINNANIRSYDAVANTSYNLMSRTALVSSETDLVKFWDNAGTITALGSTTLVGHRLYRFSSGNFAMQYGQGNYANMSLAKAGVLTEEYVLNPALKDATFFGWWFIESTATNTGGTTLTDFKEYTIGLQGGSSSSLSGALLKGNNLSDLLDASTARTNIGLGNFTDPNTFTGDLTITGDLNFVDNDKAIFGTGGDLEIYHNGTNSIIEPAIDNSEDLYIGGIGKSFTRTWYNAYQEHVFGMNGSTKMSIDGSRILVADDLTVGGDVTAVDGDFSGYVEATDNLIVTGTSPVFTANATGGSSGLRINVTGSGAGNNVLYRFQNAGSTIYTMLEDGSSSQNGNVTAVNGVFSGTLGVGSIGTVKELSIGMENTLARFRERESVDSLSISTNINDSGNNDDITKSSWRLLMGAGLDSFKIGRGAANSSTINDFITINSTGAADFASDVTVGGDVSATGSVQVGDDTSTAVAGNVGATRYRISGNNSYMDMVMQTGAATYAWVNIKTNSW